MLRGRFVLFPDTCDEHYVENNILDEGEISFLKMIARADVVDIAAGGNWFVGLCGAAFLDTTTLATLVGEPTAAGGYARKAVTRNAGGWPTLGEVNGVNRIRTVTFTWTPAGADYSTTIQRFFLCNVAAGSAGLLMSVSGAFPDPIQLVDAVPFPAAYELYLR